MHQRIDNNEFVPVAELPETIFTRSISNPEAVMRRRRQQKLEKKLQQFRSKDGGPDTGTSFSPKNRPIELLITFYCSLQVAL